MVSLFVDRGGKRRWRGGPVLVFGRRGPARGETFPWGTIIVNVVDCFIIGFYATITGPDGRIFADTLTGNSS